MGGKGGLCWGDEEVNDMAVVTCLEENSDGSEMLEVQPLTIVGESVGAQSVTTDWVVERVKDFCRVVGLTCDGFEDKLMELVIAIDAKRNGVGKASEMKAKTEKRSYRGLKRLACLVNYEAKEGQSSRMTRKGRDDRCQC